METITKFKVGQELSARSACDWDCIFRYTVVSRTAKFVTVEDRYSTLKRVGIKVRDGVEYCYPLGTFSMAPSIWASEAK